MSDVEFDEVTGITSEQVRAARGLLKWPKERLATEAGIAPATVTRVEAGSGRLQTMVATEVSIRDAFTRHGVVFIKGGCCVKEGAAR